jgi:protoporphyrinogen oxidase
MTDRSYECCILGAGPAGLGTAVELVNHGVTNILVVDRHKVVGGLARTDVFGNARFDVGPHRFFTKNAEINTLWHETLGPDFLSVDRLTRIYHKNKFFRYPIKPVDVVSKLGFIESTHALLSFVAARLTSNGEALTFEDWITARFGRKLYDTFFRTYTEKVWGIPGHQIGAEWAAQRIKGLDIIKVIKASVLGESGGTVKTLAERFNYPVLGAGHMHEVMAEKIAGPAVDWLLGAHIVSVRHANDRIASVDVRRGDGTHVTIHANHFFSSLPITHFVRMLDPEDSKKTMKAAEALYYREHITVNLLVSGRNPFPDQWIYVHSPEVQMARIANYNNFSKAMTRDADTTALSVEYFAFQHEALWEQPDDALIELASQELAWSKLLSRGQVEGAWVVRERESYPTYYLGFREPYEILKNRMNEFQNLSAIGRGGMYKYNNQDHSTYSGILAARNYLKLPGSPYDLWKINIDAEYQES